MGVGVLAILVASAGIAAVVANFGQVFVDIYNKQYLSAVRIASGPFLGLASLKFGIQAVKYAWGYVWLIAKFFASGNLVGGVMLLARALKLKNMQEVMDSRSIRYATSSFMAGVFGLVEDGSGCG